MLMLQGSSAPERMLNAARRVRTESPALKNLPATNSVSRRVWSAKTKLSMPWTPWGQSPLYAIHGREVSSCGAPDRGEEPAYIDCRSRHRESLNEVGCRSFYGVT